MENTENYNDEEFIINLTIEGTEYEVVEVRVSDPYKSIREQIESIVAVFNLPKMDNGGRPLEYHLGQIIKDESEDKILEYTKDGREQTFLDYNVQPGDSLHLFKIPIAG